MKLNAILVAGLLVCLNVAAIAQPEDGDERVRAMHVAFITDRLRLSPEESQAFWPVYNEYREKEKTIRESYRPDANLANLSEQEADALINDQFEKDQELLDLRKAYYKRLLTHVPAKKLAVLQKAEREFKEKLIEEIRRRRQQRQGNKRN
ncbi:MAG: hypothetical protein GYB31_04480 [Bacteroidetes bacterium]|nr:hypothetical protein [Bacteroidota bacterium]